jgi:hypothetical protein
MSEIFDGRKVIEVLSKWKTQAPRHRLTQSTLTR